MALIVAARKLVEAEGRKSAETIEEMVLERVYMVEGVLTEDHSERYDELAELAQGEVLDDIGLIRREEKAAIETDVLQASRLFKDDTPKSPYSQKLAGDLFCIARGARQNASLENPDLLLDLLVFQLSGGMGFRTAFGTTPELWLNLQRGFDLAMAAKDERLAHDLAEIEQIAV